MENYFNRNKQIKQSVHISTCNVLAPYPVFKISPKCNDFDKFLTSDIIPVILEITHKLQNSPNSINFPQTIVRL